MNRPADHAAAEKESTDAALATYTYWLMAFTGILAVATIVLAVSTVGLWNYAAEQARDMKESLGEARRSANAAVRAAEVSETALIITQRAVVTVAQIETAPWENPPGKFAGWAASVVMKNTGPTRANNVESMVKVDIFDGAIPENFDFTVPRPTTPVTVSIAGGGGTANSEPRAFTNDDLIAVREGKKNVLIWGAIRYHDVLPDTPQRITNFCYRLLVYRDPFNPQIVPINYGAYGTHNSAE